MRALWTQISLGILGFVLLGHPALADTAKAPAPIAQKGEMKLEVVVVPVSDVDRAKKFYGDLGWRLDADISKSKDHRVVQFTPPGSRCSIIFGKGVTDAKPGSLQDLTLAVSDVEATRKELAGRGANVSEVFHYNDAFHDAGTAGRIPGPDPQHRSYASWASFKDPDGNGWMLQEVTARRPGREEAKEAGMDVPTLTELLREAEKHHGAYEPTAPKHNWSDWYAAYIVARQNGKTPDDAAKDAAAHVEVANR
jgi:catechol 2,3-dioxygenase-like lactoylglutathione lyase family enzyme